MAVPVVTGDEWPLTVVGSVEIILFNFQKLRKTWWSPFWLADQNVSN